MKNRLYKFIIYDVTEQCYENCLNYFPEGSRILDVGIGNGAMLEKFHRLIRAKGLKLTGIDINKSYIDHCDRLIRTYSLEDHISIHHEPVEAYRPPENNYFDFVLFSMSFMLFSDQKLVLDRIRDCVRPGGEIVFFQTMFKDRSPLIEFVKPKLKYVTTIDFGRVTYERDFFALLREKKLSVCHDRLIKREWFKGEYRMIVASPENGRFSTRTATDASPVMQTADRS